MHMDNERSPKEVVGQLWELAQNHAKASNFKFEKHCELDVQSMIEAGVDKLSGMGRLNDPQAIQEAEENLKSIVSEMINIALAKGVDSLHEWTLGDALKNLCPLFPFC